MRKTREVLRLRWACGRTVSEAAESLGISTGVVSKTTTRAKTAGLDWEAVEKLDDETLERRLYGAPAPRGEARPRSLTRGTSIAS